jgi:hypothetical protein
LTIVPDLRTTPSADPLIGLSANRIMAEMIDIEASKNEDNRMKPDHLSFVSQLDEEDLYRQAQAGYLEWLQGSGSQGRTRCCNQRDSVG